MSDKQRSSSRAHLITALKLLLSVALLATVITVNKSAFSEAFARQPSWIMLAFALAWYLAGVMLAFGRWRLLVRALDLPFSLRDAFRLGWVGMFFNMVIPGAVGGDIVKGAYIARQQHHKEKAIASVVIDRLVGLIGLFILAAIGGAIAWGRFDSKIRPVVISAWVALAVTIAITAAAFWINPNGPIARGLARRDRGRKLIQELHATGLAYRSRFGWVVAAIAMAAITHIGNVIAFACVCQAFPVSGSVPGPLGFLTVVPLVLFSTAIPLPFSGLGASESVSAVLFRSFDYRAGAVGMIGFRLLQFTAAVIGAFFYLTHKGTPRGMAGQPYGIDFERDAGHAPVGTPAQSGQRVG